MKSVFRTFIIYARSDEMAKSQLVLHLRPLLNNNMISLWHDGDILPGEDWEKAIKKELESSDIVLLLVSAKSLSSQFIQSQELKTALDRLKIGLTRVIPILISPCAWKFDPIVSGMQCLPLFKSEGPTPVSDKAWQNEHEAWVNVVENIGNMIKELYVKKEELERLAIENHMKDLEKQEEFRKQQIEYKQNIDQEAQQLSLFKSKLEELKNEKKEFGEQIEIEQKNILLKKEKYRNDLDKEREEFELAISSGSKSDLQNYLAKYGSKAFFAKQAKNQIDVLSKNDLIRMNRVIVYALFFLPLLLVSLLLYVSNQNYKLNDDIKKKSNLLNIPESPLDTTSDATIFISLRKMNNVLYLGVDNPMTIATNISTKKARIVSRSNVSIQNTSPGNYILRANTPGTSKLTIFCENIVQDFTFRVKPIPDPVAKINNSTGGEIGNGVFKAQGGVIPVLENFDFETRCDVLGFTMIYIPRREDPIQAINPGSAFGDSARGLINQAKPGDIYIFDNIRAKCPGDAAGRKINDIAFKIQ